MKCAAFNFLNNHLGRPIIAIFQDDNVHIHHQAQIVNEWFGGSMKNRLHMNWLLWVQALNSLKVFGMCWRRLYRVLDSCIVYIRSRPKTDAPLDGNKCCHVISKRGINIWSKMILYEQWKSPAL